MKPSGLPITSHPFKLDNFSRYFNSNFECQKSIKQKPSITFEFNFNIIIYLSIKCDYHVQNILITALSFEDNSYLHSTFKTSCKQQFKSFMHRPLLNLGNSNFKNFKL